MKKDIESIIKVGELRIGNLLKWKGADVIVRAEGFVKEDEGYVLHYYEVESGLSNVTWLDDFEFIPLTEKRLLQFAFKPDSWNGAQGQTCSWKKKLWIIEGNPFYTELKVPYGEKLNIPLPYVHTLQNLYFAVIGKELELK